MSTSPIRCPDGLLYVFKPTQIPLLAKINLMNKQNGTLGLRFMEKVKAFIISHSSLYVIM